MTHSALQANHGYVEGVGRIRLHYRTWEVESPDAALIVVHGMFEHSRRYQELAETLGRSGISTFAIDLRGHGESAGRRGHATRFNILLQDLDRFRREVRGLIDVDTPLFLLGHSLGGLISLRYLEEYEPTFDGAIISAPWLGTAYDVPRWKVLLAHVADRIAPALPFPEQLDVDKLSRDPERVADYRDDPLIHRTITPRMFSEISGAIDLALRRGDRIDVPLMFLLPGDDRIISTDRSLAFARGLEGHRTTIRLLEGFYHEVLQDRGRGAVIAEVRDWILDVAESRGPATPGTRAGEADVDG